MKSNPKTTPATPPPGKHSAPKKTGPDPKDHDAQKGGRRQGIEPEETHRQGGNRVSDLGGGKRQDSDRS